MRKLSITLFALLGASATLALAASPPKGKQPAPAEVIFETTAERLILPNGINGMLVFSECEGCPRRSLRTSSSTSYRFNERDLTLVEFRDAITRLPKTNVNVVVSGKTRELTRLDATNETASLPAARPARNRNK